MKKIFSMLLLLTVSLTLISCGNKDPEVDDQGKSIIRMFINEGNLLDGKQKDRIWKEIEEKANVSLRIEGASHNSDYYTTLNPMINTGDIPDIIFSDPNQTNAYNNWVDQDILHNIDLLLAEKPGEYPWIEKLFESTQYKNISFGGGKRTLIPYLTSANGWGIYYRTDWLINVGYSEVVDGKTVAKIPTTIEEFADVLKLFTENDPDGNGKKDTFGMSPGSGAFYLNPLYGAFGVTPSYDLLDNGDPTYMYIRNEFKDFLEWFSDMYKKGYIDPQYVTNSNYADRDKFYEGKVGILITNAEQHITWIADGFESRNGKGILTMGDAPKGTANLGKEGSYGFSDWGGWWGGFSISTDCKDPHAALRFLDFMYSPEGTALRMYGIKDVHYTEDSNGEVIPNVTERSKEPTGTFLLVKDQETGTMNPTGFAKIGTLFSGYINWNNYDTEGKIGIKLDSKSMDASVYQLIDLAAEKNVVLSGKLTNLSGFPSSYTVKMKRLEDYVSTYVTNAIMGTKNLSTDWDAMQNEIIKTYEWKSIQDMIIEVATSTGLID